MSRPTTTQISAAVKELATSGITNSRIADVFASTIPATYTLTIQQEWGSLPRRWVVASATTWQKNEAVVPGKGLEIITRLLMAAWDHAASVGETRTLAELREYLAAHPFPVCPECGRTVLPAEGAASSHPNFHPDCC